MTSIQQLTDKIKKFVKDRDWEQFHNHKDLALSLVLEAAEVLEHFQWKNGIELDEYISLHKEDLADELADVFYWVLRISDKLGIDIIKAHKSKLEKAKLKYPVDKARGNNKKYTEL